MTTLEQQTNGNMIKSVTLQDDESGLASGWDPNGIVGGFRITDAHVDLDTQVLAKVLEPGRPEGIRCSSDFTRVGSFDVFCFSGLSDGSELHYVVINSP